MYTISTDVEITPDPSLSSPTRSVPKWGFSRKSSTSSSSSCILLMLPDGGVRIMFSPVQVRASQRLLHFFHVHRFQSTLFLYIARMIMLQTCPSVFLRSIFLHCLMRRRLRKLRSSFPVMTSLPPPPSAPPSLPTSIWTPTTPTTLSAGPSSQSHSPGPCRLYVRSTRRQWIFFRSSTRRHWQEMMKTTRMRLSSAFPQIFRRLTLNLPEDPVGQSGRREPLHPRKGRRNLCLLFAE